MIKKYFLLPLAGFVASFAYSQSLYVTTNVDGSNIFTDTPLVNSVLYTSMNNPISSFNGVNAANSPAAAINTTVAVSNQPVSAYAAITITQPADQATFHNQTPISVIVLTQPDLKAGEQVQLMLDGVAYGLPQRSLNFSLMDLARGKHQLQAVIIDKDGNSLKNSAPITFFKQQASLL